MQILYYQSFQTITYLLYEWGNCKRISESKKIIDKLASSQPTQWSKFRSDIITIQPTGTKKYFQFIGTYCWVKNATQGNRRSWVSTNTFWTYRFGEQLCCWDKHKTGFSKRFGRYTSCSVGIKTCLVTYIKTTQFFKTTNAWKMENNGTIFKSSRLVSPQGIIWRNYGKTSKAINT